MSKPSPPLVLQVPVPPRLTLEPRRFTKSLLQQPERPLEAPRLYLPVRSS